MSDKGQAKEHHHQHHRHHHQQHMDDATKFKHNSLRAIVIRKKAAKIGFRILIGIAILLAIYALYVYTIGYDVPIEQDPETMS